MPGEWGYDGTWEETGGAESLERSAPLFDVGAAKGGDQVGVHLLPQAPGSKRPRGRERKQARNQGQ